MLIFVTMSVVVFTLSSIKKIKKLKKLPILVEVSGFPSNIWFLGPHDSTLPPGISIGSNVSAGLTNVTNKQTDTQTDYATASVATGSI